MKIYQGKSLNQGIVSGKVTKMTPVGYAVSGRKVADTDAECERFRCAEMEAVQELERRYLSVREEIGEQDAGIFKAQKMILEDEEFQGMIIRTVKEKSLNAEYAVMAAEEYFSGMLDKTGDLLIRRRMDDLRDVAGLLKGFLQREKRQENSTEESETAEEAEKVAEEGRILVTEDLLPGDVIRIQNCGKTAVVSYRGTENSHAVILARALGIPVVSGIKIGKGDLGQQGILDGTEGKLILDPARKTVVEYRKKTEAETKRREILEKLSGKENVTKSGKKMELYANINDKGELNDVCLKEASGIGLLRSEFLFFDRDSAPTEEEQFQVYKEAVLAMKGKPVVIRTADLGADKKVPYLQFPEEENPALGLRGIRFSLTHPELFCVQMRAVLRAAMFGPVSVLYPMITSVDEIKAVREIRLDLEKNLKAEKIPFGPVHEGIMIETPAAAVLSDRLAEETDFFSIGTNDLIQYTEAVDRRNPGLEHFHDRRYEAVFRLIEMVVKNAHEKGIPVEICGELGAAPELTDKFLEIGVDMLSVSPAMILTLREKIRNSAGL